MKTKKLLTLILALAMVFSLMAVGGLTAYADTVSGTITSNQTWNDGDEVNGATISGNTTITVNGDVKVSSAITISGNVTFTGGGKLIRTSTSGSIITVSSGADLTLNNITIDGGGVVVSGASADAAVYVNRGGDVIMNNGAALTNHKKSELTNRGGAVYVDGGTFTMNGGTISGCQAKNYGGAVYLSDGSEFTMKDGTIENNTTLADSIYGGGAFYVREAKLTVSGGTIRNNSSACGGAIYNSSYGTTIIKGGTITGNSVTGDDPKGGAIYHSCRQGDSSSLQIGGNANIEIDNDVYLSSESSDKFLEITSSIANPIFLTVENLSDGRVIATAASGVTLTYNDMAKIGIKNTDYVLKLEDNQIKLAKSTGGDSVTYPVYLGYDANGGENAPDGETKNIAVGESATFTVTSGKPTRAHYNFLGWATSPDATEAEYQGGNTITDNKNIVLYAVWEKGELEQNVFTTPLSIEGWTYGDEPNEPIAEAKYGTPEFTYSDAVDGTYTKTVPTEAGTYYVKATVEGTEDYTQLVSAAKKFVISPKTLTAANISAIPDQTYQSGAAVKPDVEIKDGSKVLKLGTDYTVAYENNINASKAAKVKVTLMNKNYRGSLEKTFTILPKTLTADNVTKIGPQEYRGGTEICPAIQLKDGNIVLRQRTDYNLSYANNVNVSDKAIVRVKIISSNYQGEFDKYFTISPRALTADNMSDIADQIYTGSEIKPAVEVTFTKYTNVVLKAGTDYTVTYTNNVNASDQAVAKVKITSPSYKGEFEKNFKILPKTLTNDNISAIADQTYTGSEIKPAIEVKDGDKVLKLGTDYTAAYENNTDVSEEAKVKVTVINKNYQGSLEKTFTILPKTLTADNISAIADQTYTGEAITPVIEVKDGDKVLELGTDYTVAYENNENASEEAKVKVTVINKNYQGSLEKTFTILPKALTNDNISAIADQTYTGEAITPVIEVKDGDKVLELGTDYTVAYENNENATEEAKVKVTVINKNYQGSLEKTFTILPKALTNDNISAIADQTYTGEAITPVIEVKDGDKVLALGTDYTVAYENNENASEEAKVKVTVINKNYQGSLEKTFVILPKTINPVIDLTAPVKNAVPQTTVETNEYTAEITWSPDVDGKFAARTAYTATITVTPKANYTVKGVQENGFAVEGAKSVTNAADSGVVTAGYAATAGSGGGTSRYTVLFETNGGSKVESQRVEVNATVTEPAAPTKDGFDFAGWYTDQELTKKYDFSAKVTQNFILYAAWNKKADDNPANNRIILTIGEKDALVFGVIKTNDVAPIIVNDRTMLPARFVAENLGAKVSWDESKQLVTVVGKNDKQEDVTILLTIGSDVAQINGADVKLDSPAFVQNDRTYTPLRFIAENLGATVDWVESEQKVIITKQ